MLRIQPLERKVPDGIWNGTPYVLFKEIFLADTHSLIKNRRNGEGGGGTPNSIQSVEGIGCIQS